jgi:hypothetical protein
MKLFYLLRHEDVNGNSGTGVVAEGVIFDNGQAAMTWLSEFNTVTVFAKVSDIKKLHGHDGRTEVVIENVKKDAKKFRDCCEMAKLKKDIRDFRGESQKKKSNKKVD